MSTWQWNISKLILVCRAKPPQAHTLKGNTLGVRNSEHQMSCKHAFENEIYHHWYVILCSIKSNVLTLISIQIRAEIMYMSTGAASTGEQCGNWMSKTDERKRNFELGWHEFFLGKIKERPWGGDEKSNRSFMVRVYSSVTPHGYIHFSSHICRAICRVSQATTIWIFTKKIWNLRRQLSCWMYKWWYEIFRRCWSV